MSTLANITSLNLSLQTGGAALAVKAAGRLVAPARTVFVYGTADDVAPNFTTVAGAITYANSLTPIVTEPVVVRLFTKADGTPYDLTGLSSWTTYANSYIYFVSDFVRLNETTTLPTTLPAGQQVWYIDANGVETLWVGREDGSAWPAVGYKEYVALLTQTGTNPPVATVMYNTLGTILWDRSTQGNYSGPIAVSPAVQDSNCFVTISNPVGAADEYSLISTFVFSGDVLVSTIDPDGAFVDGVLGQSLTNVISIRVYP